MELNFLSQLEALQIQTLDPADQLNFDFDPLDATKVATSMTVAAASLPIECVLQAADGQMAAGATSAQLLNLQSEGCQ